MAQQTELAPNTDTPGWRRALRHPYTTLVCLIGTASMGGSVAAAESFLPDQTLQNPVVHALETGAIVSAGSLLTLTVASAGYAIATRQNR